MEREAADHPRTLEVLSRLPKARVVPCDRWGQIFNPRAQNFRLQKAGPSLILGRKHDRHLQRAPDEYNLGSSQNYYFSHLLNCPYDCRYCFLQGMFRSAHYVMFVNFEAFEEAIERELDRLGERSAFFFSGYDCDSLALDGLTGFCDHFLPFFARNPRGWLELRTKSASFQALDRHEPFPTCVVASSFSPGVVGELWEAGVPPLERRIEALREAGRRGWRLGLRFDPLIWWPDAEVAYQELFRSVFSRIDPAWIHSVTLGTFRLPAPFFRRMADLYPEERLFAAPLENREGLVTYRRDLEETLYGACKEALGQWIGPQTLFPAGEDPTREPDPVQSR